MAGTLITSTLQGTTLTDGTNSTSTTNCIKGSAKAWVNFNGTGTVAIRASYNVSSVTRASAGQYTVNFTNAFADTNYAAMGSTNANRILGIDIQTTTSCGCDTQSSGAFSDESYIALSYFK